MSSETPTDNPAGRLYELLLALGRNVSDTSNIAQVWAGTLGVPESDVQIALGPVHQLVKDIKKATAGDPALTELVDMYEGAWITAVFPKSLAFTEASRKVKIEGAPLNALAVIARVLTLTDPDEGHIPAQDELASLMAELDDLIGAVASAVDLPDEVRSELVDELQQIRIAIQNLKIGGVKPVTVATDAAVGTIIRNASHTWKSVTAKRVAAFASTLWIAFGVPATVQQGLPAWGDLVAGHLEAGGAQVVPTNPPGTAQPPATGGK